MLCNAADALARASLLPREFPNETEMRNDGRNAHVAEDEQSSVVTHGYLATESPCHCRAAAG